MYERFTDRARKVMQLANQEAQRFNHEYIGTEHVLLGLAKEGSGVAAKVIKSLGIDLRKIRLEVEKLVQSGPEMVTMGKLPQTPDMKRGTEIAMAISQEMKLSYVGTEHLLLGLLQVRGVAKNVLTNLKVSTDQVKELTLEIIGQGFTDQTDRNSCDESGPQETMPWYDRRVGSLSAQSSLVTQAKAGRLAPSCGPWKLEQLVTALNRSWRNSILIVGEPGVGKRTLVEKLAMEMAHRDVSNTMALGNDIEEVALDRSPSRIAKKLEKANHKSLLFFEDIQSFLDPVRDNVLEFPIWLTAAIKRGARCIGTISLKDEKSFAERVTLAAYFERIEIAAAPLAQTAEIVKTREAEYTHNHQVTITDDAIQEAYVLAEHYGALLYPCHSQPATTLDVIENAAAFSSWRRAKADGAASASGSMRELRADDVVRAVALRLGSEVEDIRNRSVS